jgi:hypothetical protein
MAAQKQHQIVEEFLPTAEFMAPAQEVVRGIGDKNFRPSFRLLLWLIHPASSLAKIYYPSGFESPKIIAKGRHATGKINHQSLPSDPGFL